MNVRRSNAVLIKMFTNRESPGGCFLCKKIPEKVFYARTTLCPGSVEPLKTVIEDLARSSKMELVLPEYTVLCLECCKMLAIFIEKKRELVDRIEKAMTYFEQFEITIKEENLSDAETSQGPIIENVFENYQHGNISAKTTAVEIKLEKDEVKECEKSTIVLEQKINKEQTRASVMETTIDNENSRDEMITIESTHEAKRFTCDQCDFVHFRESRLILHKNTHKGLKESQCPNCYKILSKIGNAIRHLETQQSCWKCPVKEKTIAETMSENEENSFMITDEEAKNYKCDLCDFAHANEHHLILHKGTHKGLKENQCPFCLKLLSDKSRCLRHMVQTHIYCETQCEKCGLCFTKLSSLINHKMQHDAEENPLFCTICNKQFKNIKTYKRHEIKHRADRPRYTCANCGKIFVDRRAYKIHLQTKHRKANQEKK